MRIKTLVLLLMLIFSLSNASQEKISLQLLWKHQFEFAGFYMAKEKGFYKDAGLDVEIKEYDFGVDIVGDVTSGKTDVGIGRSSLVLEKLRGKDIVLSFALYQSSPYVLVSKKRDDLKEIDDFKDKRIMLSDNLESIAAISAMMKIRDIKQTDYTELPHSFNIDDLVNDKVDLMTTYMSNEVFHLKEKKIDYTIFNPRDYGFNFYADLVFTSQKYLKKNNDKIIKFRKASIQGWEYAFSHIDETIALIQKKYNTQNKSAYALQYEANVLKKLAYVKGTKFGDIDEQRVKEIANLYRLLGMTKKSNEQLEDIIHKPFSFMQLLKSVFTIELLIAIVSLISIIIFLSLYKQHILKKQNLLLEEAKKQADQANKFKSEFLANMSHEIRTPMTGILGFVDQLQKAEKDPERIKQFETIRSSGKTLLCLINDILDFSKIESGKMDIEYHPYDLHQLISSTTDIFSQLLNEKEITFENNVQNDLPKCIVGDQVRLKQVIFNLLSNAIKFTPQRGKITLDINYNNKNKMIYVAVIDTGVGISKDNLEKIFEAFGQEDSSTTRKFGGTGLGLTISLQLIKIMGGELKVDSVLGKGSKFYFELPIQVCSENELQDITSDNENEKIVSKSLKGHVLIVEDNKTNQLLLGMILDNLGMTHDIANDGVEAIEKFNKNQYDAILMDENMPNMNGMEATKRIRLLENQNNLKNIHIIAITANAMADERQKFLDAGMDDYISKPYSEEDILLALEKVLNNT